MSTDRKIRTAVIGLGGRGLYFAKMYSEQHHPGFALTALCDLKQELLDKARNRYGDTVSYHTDMNEMLQTADIDAVLVATNDPDHIGPTLAALDAGKHVLVEKPFSQTVEDATTMIERARHSKGILMVGFELRECTVFQTMQRLLKEDRIGPIKTAHVFDNVAVGGLYFYHDPKKQAAFFKSLLLQKACHSLDLLNWFIGSQPTKVYGSGGLDYYGGSESNDLRCRSCDKSATCPYAIDHRRFQMDYGVEVEVADYCVWSKQMNLRDNSALCIDYASGARATFHECHFTPDYTREFCFVGPKGKLYGYYDNPGRFLVRIEYSHSAERRTEEWKPMTTGGAHGGGDNRLRDEFYRRIVENDPPLDALSSAYYSTALAICAEESIDSGMPVKIPVLDEGVAK